MGHSLPSSVKFNSILDWGCGRGYDVAYYASEGIYSRGYDPHFSPDMPSGKFDLVTCAYVLNVCKNYTGRLKTLKKAKTKLRRGGHMLVCVRSDKEIERCAVKSGWEPEGDGFVTKSGTFQCGLSAGELSFMMTMAGLNVIEHIGSNYQEVVWALGRKKWFLELHSKLGSAQSEIETHIHKSLEIICEIYGGKLDWWQYPSYDCERCDGEMSPGGSSINIYVRCNPGLDEEPLYDGDSLTCNFPTEFLFISLDEIRELVSASKEEQRIEAEKEKAKKKKQRDERKAKKAALQKSARTKLTKEEAKALGLK
jgi:hypothetical protein